MRLLKTVLLAAAACAGVVGTAHAQSFGFASFSAEINANGTTKRGVGIKNSKRTTQGIYQINFMRDVVICSIVASPRGKAGGQISVAKIASIPHRIRLYTYSRTGQAANMHFTVLVNCTS
jgi:hypothetical protein